MEAGRKRPYSLKADSLAMLLPVATWKIKDVPNDLEDLDKEIYRPTVQSANWLLLLLPMKSKSREIR